jgi:Family of unknown function (DUF6527)
MSVFSRIRTELARLWRRLFKRSLVYRAGRVSDVPDGLNDGIVYIVGADGYDWSALMRCPGGCGKTLEMNLLPTAKPVWRMIEHEDGVVSLHPSVWLKSGCKCHFVLHHGAIRWV